METKALNELPWGLLQTLDDAVTLHQLTAWQRNAMGVYNECTELLTAIKAAKKDVEFESSVDTLKEVTANLK
jgi:hypothetical protein